MAGTPTWFGATDRRLFGWLHRPGDGRARGMAVLCAPIGHEEASALPALQALADRLADDGVAALRFAYGGTGDSAGWWSDPGRLDDWVASVDEALLFARRAHGGPVVLVGMRMGALLAAEAVARGGKVEGLVLWDPCHSGRDFLRVERTLLAAGYGAAQLGDGSVAGPAFTYAVETAAELESLALVPPEPGTHATLVLARPDGRVRQLRSAFADAGADWEVVVGQAELLDVPPDMLTVPAVAVDRASRWIGKVTRGPVGDVRFEPADDAVVSCTDDGRAVTEHPVWLGPHRLFGMATHPPGDRRSTPGDRRSTSGDRRSAGPTLVFLSAGALDHTGPGRLWVELARRLAAEGLRSVRIDIDGIGETFGRPGRARQVPKPPEAIDDVVDAAKALEPEGADRPGGPGRTGRTGPDDLVLVGLSSGAYHAIEAGLRLRLAGVAAVNPGLTTWVPELEQGTVDPRRLAFRPMPRALRALAVEHRRVARWAWRAVLQLWVGRSAAHPVAGVSRRGTPVLLVTSRADAQQFEPSLYWWAVRRRLGRRGLLDVEVVPGGDHSLYTPDGRRDASPILFRWLLARRTPGVSPGSGPTRHR